MKLFYRGISYESTSSNLEIKEGEIAGKYRGQSWKYHYPRHIPQSQSKFERNNQGLGYSIGTNSHFENPPNEVISSCPVPLKKTNLVTVNNTDKIHLENIRQKLERRLQIAKERGDNNLVNLLEKESKEIALF